MERSSPPNWAKDGTGAASDGVDWVVWADLLAGKFRQMAIVFHVDSDDEQTQQERLFSR
jgi:hypothetical protein